jgi:hypothetical protein
VGDADQRGTDDRASYPQAGRSLTETTLKAI